ncbi:hypothetical protein PHMEG_00015251 [Phytophthora megakarya]|uniref:Transmembrane protein n=1 Tax=Phytophthora megakarya TaxID=4795 RepID=A0A225W4C0_9STRA|nr:hypothetical protein PHMEG_00015251 [Phytophthora megakarya]
MWKCSHPLNESLPAVRLWDHIDIRYQSLRQRYPTLDLDVTLLSSQRLSSTSGVLSSTYYNYEAHEITVLTRGRSCSEPKTQSAINTSIPTCTTIFVDDFRYERDTVRTNLVEWYPIIAFLRGGAQTYVWIRLVLLIYGAHSSAKRLSTVKTGSSSHVMSTLSIVFKIPFEVIVYSSLLPVCGYVIAQLLDSSFMDIYLDSYWAAVGGTIKINLVTFLRSTAVQMRNVWLLALLVTFAMFVVRNPRDYWGERRPAIRGLVISFTSTLTVFGPYKPTTLRDTNIIKLFVLSGEGQIMDIIRSNSIQFNFSSYFFDVSPVMLAFCIGVVIGLAVTITFMEFVMLRSIGSHHETRDIILSSTTTLYLYRIRLPSATFKYNLHSYVIILPYAEHEMEEQTGFCPRYFQLLDSANSRDVCAMRSTFYNYEALEMVVLTRGSANTSAKLNSTMCTTVFVDDYRYERDIVQTNLVDWYWIISMLRGGAQTYVWIRVLLLGYGSYVVAGQSVDQKSKFISRLVTAISIVLKIPFQVIVYSSLVPVSAYVVALLLDSSFIDIFLESQYQMGAIYLSSFIDIFLESYWASVGGAVNIKWVPFIQTTSVQMRGVWFLALFASALLFVMRRSRYLDDGIFGIRGLLISFTSSLTVFGPYKSVFYRDMDITDVFRVPDEGPTMDIVQSAYSSDCFNSSSYIFDSSAKTLMNIAMMTDPWSFFWLRVIGIQLYLYKIRPPQPASWDIGSYAVVLPYAPDEMEERTGLNRNDYQLLDSASSRDVPTSVLLQCG